jgi:hypothetical protein
MLQLYSEVLNIIWFLNPDNGQKVKYLNFLNNLEKDAGQALKAQCSI